MKRRNIARLFAVLLIMSLMLSVLPLAVSAREPELITTESGLKEALHNASEGDTILVGDIEFAYSPMGMTLSKGVTVKSGKDTPAVFSGGAIWADQATVTLESCKISGNRFENFYPDTLTKGGYVMTAITTRTAYASNV